MRQQPSPTVTFQSLKDAVHGYSPISILSQLAVRLLFVRTDEFQSESSQFHRHHTLLEFLTGLLAVQPFPSDTPTALTVTQCDDIWKRLNDYFESIDRDLMVDSLEHNFSELEMEAKHNSLMIRGEAYPHQLQHISLGLYQEHDTWFRNNLGFTIAEALHAVHAVTHITASRYQQTIDTLNDPAKIGVRTESLARNATRILGFTVEELATVSQLPITTCTNLMKRLSQDFGYRNTQHQDTFTNPKTCPWDFNTLYERPFMHHEGTFFLFVPPVVLTALSKTFWFDVHDDESYRKTFNDARARWLEREVAENLRKIFGEKTVILNPKKANKQQDELCDVLVMYDSNLIIVQCKSKGLRHQARIGKDSDAIIDDVRKAVVEAFDQGIKAREYLSASEKISILAENGVWDLSPRLTNGIYLLTVTLFPLQFLTTRLMNSKTVSDLFARNEFPWAISLPDLDIVTDILRTPVQFLHYARRRLQIERTSFSIMGDEIDLLSLYLAGDHKLDLPQFEGFNSVMIAGMSTNIDEYVWKKYDQGLPVDPPVPVMSPEFAKLIHDIVATKCFGATDCAMALLDISGNARTQLLDGM